MAPRNNRTEQTNYGEERDTNQNNQGQMSVSEAGHRGGEATSQTHGREFYENIGHKGGQRVRELIDEGKQNEQQDERR